MAHGAAAATLDDLAELRQLRWPLSHGATRRVDAVFELGDAVGAGDGTQALARPP